MRSPLIYRVLGSLVMGLMLVASAPLAFADDEGRNRGRGNHEDREARMEERREVEQRMREEAERREEEARREAEQRDEARNRWEERWRDAREERRSQTLYDGPLAELRRFFEGTSRRQATSTPATTTTSTVDVPAQTVARETEQRASPSSGALLASLRESLGMHSGSNSTSSYADLPLSSGERAVVLSGAGLLALAGLGLRTDPGRVRAFFARLFRRT